MGISLHIRARKNNSARDLSSQVQFLVKLVYPPAENWLTISIDSVSELLK